MQMIRQQDHRIHLKRPLPAAFVHHLPQRPPREWSAKKLRSLESDNREEKCPTRPIFSAIVHTSTVSRPIPISHPVGPAPPDKLNQDRPAQPDLRFPRIIELNCFPAYLTS